MVENFRFQLNDYVILAIDFTSAYQIPTTIPYRSASASIFVHHIYYDVSVLFLLTYYILNNNSANYSYNKCIPDCATYRVVGGEAKCIRH